MTPRPINVPAFVAAFDTMSNDAVVPDAAAAAILNIDINTLRRSNPVPQIKLSERRRGRRVGDLRALIRGAREAAE